MKDNETIKELKVNLKKANNELKERSLLLDMYKSAPKETRDKVLLMAEEKKIRIELDEAKYVLKLFSLRVMLRNYFQAPAKEDV